MFSGLAGAVGSTSAGLDMSRAGVEVRFEWVRGRKRRRAVRGEPSEQGQDPSRTVGTGRRIRGQGAGSRPVSIVDRPVSVMSVGGGDGLDFSTVASESLAVPGPVSGRAPSVIASERSVSPRRRSIDSKPRSRRGSSPVKRGASPIKKGVMARNDSSSSREDDGEESDPEDSETPWSCTLRVLPMDLPPPPSADEVTPTATDPSLPTGLKLRLAHLVPAPHHPKVIGQFKMPFPLPDVSVSRMELVHRAPGDAFGLGGGRQEVGRGEMVMTAEEIKDVVSTTGLWLMVREGFGGLGGKKRKGDGWKIRS